MKKLLHFSLTLLLLLTSKAIFAGGPTASFTVSPNTTVTPGTNVCFTNTSSGSGNTYSWTFAGQAPNSTATTPPCVVYNTVGTYQVCLTATNSNGSNGPNCQTITVSNAVNIGTANGTTVSNACGMMLEDAGGAADYGNNQTHTVTFCSGNTNYISMVLGSLTLAAGDQIQFYAGTGTGGALLSTLTSANNGTTPSIYANNTCITVRFSSDAVAVAAGFSMQAACYANNQIIMGTNNTSNFANACGYSIFDPGYNANYGNNQNNTTTICASSASQVPQILFDSFNLTAGDVLNVYNGSNTSGQLIYDAANTDNGNNSFISPGLTITGLSQCMTLQFISNASGVSAGFNGSITCKTPPTPCNSNPVPADNMDAAPMICDFSQYCGTTSSFYGVDMPNIDQTAVFNGSFENNSWLKFIADATTASFTITTASSSCYIQIGVYEISATEGFVWKSPASINSGFDYTNISTGFAGTGTLNVNGLIPGNQYYILIDGHGGSVCNYSLTAGIGVQLPVAQASPDLTLNCNQNGAISVTNTNGSTANVNWDWTWTGPTAGGPVAGSSLNLTGLAPGVYTYTVTATEFNKCVTTAIDDQVIVTVNPCPLPVELASIEAQAKENFNEITWTTASENNSSYFLLERSSDLQNWEKVNQVASAGNSNGMLRYFALDYAFENTINYYRLTQVDIDGAYKIYDVVSVDNTLTNKAIDKVYNFMGQEVSIDTPGAKIILYKDGSSKKVMD